MRNLNSALPFLLLFFLVIIFVGQLTQICPYQGLTENLSAGRAADSKREIVRATVVGSENEVLVAGRGTAPKQLTRSSWMLICPLLSTRPALRWSRYRRRSSGVRSERLCAPAT